MDSSEPHQKAEVNYRLGTTGGFWAGDFDTRENATCGELTAAFTVGVDSSIELERVRYSTGIERDF